MGDRRYANNALNNNHVESSPSKLELNINNNEPNDDNKIVNTEIGGIQSHDTKQIRSSDNTPTKKSVASSILSLTSSILAAAAASSVATGRLSASPAKSPRKDVEVIDLSSNHLTPLKRGSDSSPSPTRRGGRATKPSPHQGTPPQSPPTPHKIICQANVETIEPTIKNSASADSIYENVEQIKSSSRLRASPNKKCSSGSKLISSLSPKKRNSPAKMVPLAETIQKSPNHLKTDTVDSFDTSSTKEALNMSARRNLTRSFLMNSACEASSRPDKG